ncbi:MAG TPA: hypothetical protein VI199_03300 [Novosphingobium sp.]
MNLRLRMALPAVVPAALLLGAAPARAADEEIQVYMDELGARGEVGLDLHVNDVLRGQPGADWPGGEAALHRWRLTPEWSLGLGGGFEAGAYLPLTTITPDGVVRAGGVKGRLKWVAPHRPTGAFWGANLEIGRVGYRLDQNPWNGELKLIGGWRNDHWELAGNLNYDFKIAGPVPAPSSLELATKVDYRVAPQVKIGIESYNGLGEVRDLGRLGASDQATYLTVDTMLGGFDIDAGIGKGYGASADATVLKFVIGVPLGLKL